MVACDYHFNFHFHFHVKQPKVSYELQTKVVRDELDGTDGSFGVSEDGAFLPSTKAGDGGGGTIDGGLLGIGLACYLFPDFYGAVEGGRSDDGTEFRMGPA